MTKSNRRPLKFNEPAPIDGGWAWMIVLSAFMHLFILVGLVRSSGMIFVELIQKYHGTAGRTSLIVSLQTGISFFLAPVITAAAEIFTCRVVCIAGSIIYSMAFIIASFLDSLQEIVLVYGILAGIGCGCCITPSPVIVGRYFDKKRALANGLAFSGTGLGSVILPQLVYVLMDKYYLHGAMLVLGAFTLQTSIFASLYRPLSLYKIENNRSTTVDDEKAAVPGCQNTEPAENTSNVQEEENDVFNDPAARCSIETFYTSREFEMCKLNERSTHRTVRRSDDPDIMHTARGSSCYECALDFTMPSYLQEMRPSLCPVSETSPVVTTEAQLQLTTNFKSRFRAIFQRICYVKNDQGLMEPLFSLQLLKNVEFLWALVGFVLFLNAFLLSMIVPAHCADLNFNKADAALMLSIQGSADMCGRLFTAATGDRQIFKLYRRQLFCLYTIFVSFFIFVLTYMLQIFTYFRPYWPVAPFHSELLYPATR